jgi:hypothetical protein
MRNVMARAAVAAAALAMAAACNSGSSADGPGTGPTTTTTVTKHASPQPTKTVIRGFHVLTSGQSATLQGAGGAAMFIKVSGPSVSTTRLSPSYGYPPEHGYFITFKIKIKDVGSTAIVIHRLDFWVRTPGLGRINTNDGSAFVSGSPRQLDTTELTPGSAVYSTISNNLTFDVSHPTGTLYYGPGGHHPTVAWRFS